MVNSMKIVVYILIFNIFSIFTCLAMKDESNLKLGNEKKSTNYGMKLNTTIIKSTLNYKSLSYPGAYTLREIEKVPMVIEKK